MPDIDFVANKMLKMLSDDALQRLRRDFDVAGNDAEREAVFEKTVAEVESVGRYRFLDSLIDVNFQSKLRSKYASATNEIEQKAVIESILEEFWPHRRVG